MNEFLLQFTFITKVRIRNKTYTTKQNCSLFEKKKAMMFKMYIDEGTNKLFKIKSNKSKNKMSKKNILLNCDKSRYSTAGI